MTTNSAIKDWKIEQKIFHLFKLGNPKKYAYAVWNADSKAKKITEADYDKFKKDYDDSTGDAPKVTFMPDGPPYFNKAFPKGFPVEQLEKSFRYYDSPGLPGRLNGFDFPGIPANLTDGMSCTQTIWVRVKATKGNYSIEKGIGVTSTFTSDLTTWK